METVIKKSLRMSGGFWIPDAADVYLNPAVAAVGPSIHLMNAG